MSGYSVFQFDETKVKNDARFLSQLSRFYCNIWRYDPNFAEYKQCPNCSRYFSLNYCETNLSCDKCNIVLVEAWDEKSVAETICDLVSLKNNFFGAVALLPDTSDTIIGFTWGYNKKLSEITDETVFKAVNNSTGYVPYFNEIASDPSFRHKGVGSSLCKMLVQWMKHTNPSLPGYLHTHENSPARRLFEKAGYRMLCYDEELGGGRIYMSIDKCGNFSPENL